MYRNTPVSVSPTVFQCETSCVHVLTDNGRFYYSSIPPDLDFDLRAAVSIGVV